MTVVRGKVSVGDSINTFSTISHNEKITVAADKMTYVTRKVNPESELGWKEDNLILDDVTLEEAMKMVGKRFAVRITIDNRELRSCLVNGYFVNDESLSEILDVICELKQAAYFVSGSNVVIHGVDGRTNINLTNKNL